MLPKQTGEATKSMALRCRYYFRLTLGCSDQDSEQRASFEKNPRTLQLKSNYEFEGTVKCRMPMARWSHRITACPPVSHNPFVTSFLSWTHMTPSVLRAGETILPPFLFLRMERLIGPIWMWCRWVQGLLVLDITALRGPKARALGTRGTFRSM